MNLRSKIITVPVVLSLVVTSLTGCGANIGEKTVAGQALHETKRKPIVLTTFTVLQDIAKNVAGDYPGARSITEPGAEIHDYQPMPLGLKSARDARLILNNGLGLECWFKKFTADSDAETANVSKGVKPIPIAEGDYEGKPNPHVWTSPKNGTLYVHSITKAFCDLDVTNCNDYKVNADRYAADIEEVGEDTNVILSNLDPKQHTLTSYEGALLYLTRDYNLNEKYLWGVNVEGAPTPPRVAEVENYVKESKVPAVFCESTVGEKMKPIVESTGMRFGGELYADSLSEADGDVPTYLDLLKYDAELITDGLTGR